MLALSPAPATVMPGNFGVNLQDRVAAVVIVEARPSGVRISEVSTGVDGLRVPVPQVVLSADTWERIAPMVEYTFNRQLAGFGTPIGTFLRQRYTVLSGRNLGQELLVLAWAVEDVEGPVEIGRIL